MRDDAFAEQVREKVEAVLNGDVTPDHVKGATSVRCAVGLILGDLEGLTTLSTVAAVEYLDPWNRDLVFELQDVYEDRVAAWRKTHVPL